MVQPAGGERIQDIPPQTDTVAISDSPRSLTRRSFLSVSIGGGTAVAILAACGGAASAPPSEPAVDRTVTATRPYAPIYRQSELERILDIGKSHSRAVDNTVNRFVRGNLLVQYRMYYRPPNLGYVVDSTGGSNIFHIDFEGLLAGESSRQYGVYFTFRTAASFENPFYVPFVEVNADNRLTVKTDGQKHPSPPVEQLLREVDMPPFNGAEDPKKLTKDDFIGEAVSLFKVPPDYNFQNANLEEIGGEKTLRAAWMGEDNFPVWIIAVPRMATLMWGNTLK